MKKIGIAAALFLSGCVTIEMPNVVSDTVKATKDIYKEATTKKTEPAATPARRVLAHSYVGADSETVAQIKQLCVNEASQKLNRIGGKEQRSSQLATALLLSVTTSFLGHRRLSGRSKRACFAALALVAELSGR